MPRVRVTLQRAGDEPFVFYTGQLEPGEIGSIVIAAALKMLDAEHGWMLSVERIPDMSDP